MYNQNIKQCAYATSWSDVCNYILNKETVGYLNKFKKRKHNCDIGLFSIILSICTVTKPVLLKYNVGDSTGNYWLTNRNEFTKIRIMFNCI